MVELKFDSEFRVIGEYLSQFDSNTLVPPVSQLLGQNDSIFLPVLSVM